MPAGIPAARETGIRAEEASPNAAAHGSASRAGALPQAEPPGEAERVHRTVALAGLVTFLVLAAVLLLI